MGKWRLDIILDIGTVYSLMETYDFFDWIMYEILTKYNLFVFWK